MSTPEPEGGRALRACFQHSRARLRELYQFEQSGRIQMGLLVLTDDKETASTIAFEHTGLRPG